MKLPEKYLKVYNLHQACLYIAFGYKTMTEEAESLHRKLNNRVPPLCVGNYPEYKKYLSAASDMLTIALKEGQITATASDKQITISEQSDVKLFVEDNIMDFVCDDKRYENAEISADELHTVFPTPIFPHHSKHLCDYTTPYIEIMYEVIIEEQITNENQGKVTALVEKIKEKMKARGLQVSNNIAETMATIMRQPSSQRGKRNTKPVKRI